LGPYQLSTRDAPPEKAKRQGSSLDLNFILFFTSKEFST
jgi:hypothetical protein